jgi:hypothetical protein
MKASVRKQGKRQENRWSDNVSLLGQLAAQGITSALGLAMQTSKLDCGNIVSAMDMTGRALQDLAGKLEDGKITEDEIEDTLEKVGARDNTPAALAAKAAIGRIIEQIV